MKPIYSVILFLIVFHPALSQVEFERNQGSLDIRVNSKDFATYVFDDDEIHRPYFHSLKTKNGKQITRNHPPIEGKDLTDHAGYHPGLWLAFGDINGQDYWRNKATARHIRFVRGPSNTDCSFTVLNQYENEEEVVCNEECTINLAPDETGVMLLWQSVFYSDDASFYFGDQEEMGLGIRMATPLIAKNGGTILNQQGGRNEKEVWGKQSPWCAYFKQTSDAAIGALMMAAPSNFRPSWFHARDYGLLTANPFGRKAFTDKDASKVVVNSDEKFTLKFGVYVFETDKASLAFFESKFKTYTQFIEKN